MNRPTRTYINIYILTRIDWPYSIARVMLSVPLRTNSLILLHHLHWLPVEFRIKLKLTLFDHKTLSISTPSDLPSLSSLLNPNITHTSLPVIIKYGVCRPYTIRGLVAQPPCRTAAVGSRAFPASISQGTELTVTPFSQLKFTTLLQKAAQNSLLLLNLQALVYLTHRSLK